MAPRDMFTLLRDRFSEAAQLRDLVIVFLPPPYNELNAPQFNLYPIKKPPSQRRAGQKSCRRSLGGMRFGVRVSPGNYFQCPSFSGSFIIVCLRVRVICHVLMIEHSFHPPLIKGWLMIYILKRSHCGRSSSHIKRGRSSLFLYYLI